MSFVSYAQNLEDVMLRRALHDVEAGFWIDVGAAHPRDYSVTHAFSERGWRGINIEPEPAFFAALQAERPRDVNLRVALGAAGGQARLQQIAGTGLSTLHAEIAERHADAGYGPSAALDVEVRTLAGICAEFAPPVVHFLKVDVEGSEAEVLAGADFQACRPWIVLVEATPPGIPGRESEGFDRLLLDAGYRECWFDGLNVFYLAAEHADRLAPAFRAPPNVFDNYVTAAQAAVTLRADDLDRQVAQLRAELAAHQEALAGLRALLSETEGRLAARETQLAEQDTQLAERTARFAAVEAAARQVEATLMAELDRMRAARDAEAAVGIAARQDGARLAAALESLQGSLSWRITAPLRRVRAALRRS
jgi:FkbM family methyltransferase